MGDKLISKPFYWLRILGLAVNNASQDFLRGNRGTNYEATLEFGCVKQLMAQFLIL